MSVVKVTEIGASSPNSFEDAIKSGIARAHKTLKHVKSAWIKEQEIVVEDGAVKEFRVFMKVTFVLED
ncbi:MAG: dodecin family protein [Gammaproteobacteria bacterium]|jgi:flavin-binding protein dodecin